MGVIDLSAYKPVPATLGDANQVANGFQTIQTLLNGNVDNNNFGAGKIFDPAKIMQNAATDKQALLWDAASSTWKPGDSLITYRRVVVQDLVNSTTLTDILAGGITIGAGVFTTGKCVRLTIQGDYFNNSGGNSQIDYQIILGGVTLVDTTAAGWTMASSGSRRPWRLEMLLSTLAGTTFNIMGGGAFFMGSAITNTVGWGRVSDDEAQAAGVLAAAAQVVAPWSIAGSVSLDTSVALPLLVKAKHSVANALISQRALDVLVEVL